MENDPSNDSENSGSSDQASSSHGISIWQELKRRKVMRVAITYAIVAWLIIQVASTTFGTKNRRAIWSFSPST